MRALVTATSTPDHSAIMPQNRLEVQLELNTAHERVDLAAQESLLVLTDVLPVHSFMKAPVSNYDPYSADKFDLFLEFFLHTTVKHEQI